MTLVTQLTKRPIRFVIGRFVIGGYTVKKIKEVAHSFFNFYIPPLWVVVGFLVVLNVWQTHGILQMKKQVRSHAKSVMSPEQTVYVATNGTAYHWRDNCSGLALELRGQDIASYRRVWLSEAKEKYGPCRFCNYIDGHLDAFREEEKRRLDREEQDFDEKVRRSLERIDDLYGY